MRIVIAVAVEGTYEVSLKTKTKRPKNEDWVLNSYSILSEARDS